MSGAEILGVIVLHIMLVALYVLAGRSMRRNSAPYLHGYYLEAESYRRLSRALIAIILTIDVVHLID